VLGMFDTEYDLANGAIRLMRATDCGSTFMAYWAKPGEPVSVVPIDDQTPQKPRIIGRVTINGVAMRALFATGAGSSALSLHSAARLGIKPGGPDMEEAGVMGGLGRRYVRTWITHVASLDIGGEQIKNAKLRVGDLGDVDFDVLLGADFFLSHRIYVAKGQRKLYLTYNGGPVFDFSHRTAPGAATPAATTPGTESPAAPEPGDADGYSRRGQVRAARGDLAGALDDLNHAIDLAPKQASYRVERAELHLRRREPLLAQSDLDHAIELDPANVPALLARAFVDRRQGNTSDVRRDIDAAAAAATKASDQRLAISAAYMSIDALAPAIAQLDLWIANHPDDAKRPIALNQRCWARALQGQQLDLALKDCNAAVSAQPKEASFRDSRGLVHLRMGDYPHALQDYDAALAADAKPAWSYYGRGLTKLKLGRAADGQADIAAATKINPKLPDEAKRYGITP
jgi:tetratricopeptide (TPR) repeat protein